MLSKPQEHEAKVPKQIIRIEPKQSKAQRRGQRVKQIYRTREDISEENQFTRLNMQNESLRN
jgi:hypothetical protein